LVVVAVAALMVEMVAVVANFVIQAPPRRGYLQPAQLSLFKLAAAAHLVRLEQLPQLPGVEQHVTKLSLELGVAVGRAPQCRQVDRADRVEPERTARVQLLPHQLTTAQEQ
jgi:hypothetical protein